MPTFRYYLLDSNRRIVAAEFLDSSDLDAAIIEAYDSCRNLGSDRVQGFEIWQETVLLHQGRWNGSATGRD
ncbi:MAG TPA: hypothetical protein VH855_07970 [Acetobacteraceae bacterium]